MNFDFLKGLKGLDSVYLPCHDAEELVNSKPYLSMTASRKSAELLAKFLYMASHANALEVLSFSEILADPQVRSFIHNKDVMDAFHFIRKSGNQAVHDDKSVSPELALAVLQNLHYVAGETARELSLIKHYPDFQAELPMNTSAELHAYHDLSAEAIEMFVQYIKQAKDSAEQRIEPYFPMQPETYDFSVREMKDFHERLEFVRKPFFESTVLFLKSYLDFWVSMARVSMIPAEENEATKVNVKMIMTLDGKENYSTDDMDALQNALITRLPFARKIIIDNQVSGMIRQYFKHENMNKPIDASASLWAEQGLLGDMRQLKRRELFTFKTIIEYSDPIDFDYCLIRDGKEISSDSIICRKYSELSTVSQWTGYMLNLRIRFDFDTHSSIVEDMHQIVRSYLPEEELSYLEDAWDDGDPGYIFCGTDIVTSDLKELQTFFDRINLCLRPVLPKCSVVENQAWLDCIESFGVAKVCWSPDGFVIRGGML